MYLNQIFGSALLLLGASENLFALRIPTRHSHQVVGSPLSSLTDSKVLHRRCFGPACFGKLFSKNSKNRAIEPSQGDLSSSGSETESEHVSQDLRPKDEPGRAQSLAELNRGNFLLDKDDPEGLRGSSTRDLSRKVEPNTVGEDQKRYPREKTPRPRELVQYHGREDPISRSRGAPGGISDRSAPTNPTDDQDLLSSIGKSLPRKGDRKPSIKLSPSNSQSFSSWMSSTSGNQQPWQLRESDLGNLYPGGRVRSPGSSSPGRLGSSGRFSLSSFPDLDSEKLPPPIMPSGGSGGLVMSPQPKGGKGKKPSWAQQWGPLFIKPEHESHEKQQERLKALDRLEDTMKKGGSPVRAKPDLTTEGSMRSKYQMSPGKKDRSPSALAGPSAKVLEEFHNTLDSSEFDSRLKSGSRSQSNESSPRREEQTPAPKLGVKKSSTVPRNLGLATGSSQKKSASSKSSSSKGDQGAQNIQGASAQRLSVSRVSSDSSLPRKRGRKGSRSRNIRLLPVKSDSGKNLSPESSFRGAAKQQLTTGSSGVSKHPLFSQDTSLGSGPRGDVKKKKQGDS